MDLHDWESEWQQLELLVRDSPADDVDQGDIASVVVGYRSLYEYPTAERTAP